MTENTGVYIRQFIRKTILKCLGLTFACVLVSIPIMFRENMGTHSFVGLFILFDLCLAVVYSFISLFSFLTSTKFVYTDGLLFSLFYFIPIVVPTTIIIFIKIQNYQDESANIPIVTAIAYSTFWTFYFFKLDRELKPIRKAHSS